MHYKILLVILCAVLNLVASEDHAPVQEHNDVHYPLGNDQFTHQILDFNHVPHPPPPPAQFFFQHPVDVNHDIHTNLIDHGDPNMAKIHEQEERRLFEDVMQNKFEMNSLHSELSEMHHQLDAIAKGKTISEDVSQPHKLEGPPVKKHTDKLPTKEGDKTPIKNILEEGKDTIFKPFLNSLSDVLGGKGLGQHFVGLGSLVPIILVKIAAKFAILTFSSRGLKALASLIPTIALLLINGIVLFLIWYQNFKARLGDNEFGDLFGNLFGMDTS